MINKNLYQIILVLITNYLKLIDSYFQIRIAIVYKLTSYISLYIINNRTFISYVYKGTYTLKRCFK